MNKTISTAYGDNQIGSFLRWASERIAKEMQIINESEIEDLKPYLKRKPGKKSKSREEKEFIIQSVDALRREGVLLSDACEKCKISQTSYATYRTDLGLPAYQ